ncbi:MAG: metallophosphoesterase [Ahrensia sp.]|nr:metallophosphoesterase [Ahrensia sp.]
MGTTTSSNIRNRPFRSVAEMDARILSNYQACVRPDDDFWFVGDFGFGETGGKPDHLERIFKALPGRKHLIIGNHDGERVQRLGWTSVQPMAEIKDGQYRVVMCHYPMITWNGARRGALHLFGHVHDTWMGSRNAINVGVDLWDFMPVRIDDIARFGADLPLNKHWHDVEPGTGQTD